MSDGMPVGSTSAQPECLAACTDSLRPNPCYDLSARILPAAPEDRVIVQRVRQECGRAREGGEGECAPQNRVLLLRVSATAWPDGCWAPCSG